MALIKKGAGVSLVDQRGTARDYAGLLEQLKDNNPDVRRWAVLDLTQYPESAEHLSECLEHETQNTVREALFTSLIKIGGPTVVKNLIPFLRSDDVVLRNGAIEALQHLPNEVAPYIETMLHDADSDFRIFAVNILADLRHPQTPIWLQEVIAQDCHINVCATAVDLLAEVGGIEVIPALEKLPVRFAQDQFIRFATEVAIRRIRSTLS